MRRIRKRAQPAELANWRKGIRPRGHIPPWRDLPDPPSTAMRTALADEQCQLCCYCTGSVSKGNFHVEHFRPRHSYQHLTYTWTNLIASCEGGGSDVVRTRRHCGHEKSNWFEEGVTVDPTRAGVEAMFRFPLDGRVVPAKNLENAHRNAVALTIEKLNLNAPSLKARRAALLKKASEDALRLDRHGWRALYLNDHAGTLQEFWPALNYNYNLIWSPNF